MIDGNRFDQWLRDQFGDGQYTSIAESTWDRFVLYVGLNRLVARATFANRGLVVCDELGIHDAVSDYAAMYHWALRCVHMPVRVAAGDSVYPVLYALGDIAVVYTGVKRVPYTIVDAVRGASLMHTDTYTYQDVAKRWLWLVDVAEDYRVSEHHGPWRVVQTTTFGR